MALSRQSNYMLGATVVAYLCADDRDMIKAVRQAFTAEEILAALTPQVLILARRVAKLDGVAATEVGDRMVAAARFYDRLNIDPDRYSA